MLRISSQLYMLLGLILVALELRHDLSCLLQGVLEVLLSISEEQEACDVWQKLHDERIFDEFEQLWLNCWIENRIELS